MKGFVINITIDDLRKKLGFPTIKLIPYTFKMANIKHLPNQ
jgi:hypothetical protein